jgi:predicted ATPase/DNA-binding SARP family transcriptional activator/tetratricopeptide (TPR) repeat protein
LGFLALQRRWVGRDELLALFWPDRPEVTARGNLRPLLARLASEPQAVGLEREPTRVRWLVDSDHEALLAAQRERRWDDAWRLAGGELLEGVTVARAPEFESWLSIERAEVRDVVRTAGLRVADAALEAGGLDDAGEVLAVLQRLDPLDEAVLRRSMVVLARSGARADALAAYAAFVERCRDELGAAPEGATSSLAEAVRNGTEGTVAERLPKPESIESVGLPTPLTPLVGRGREVAEVVARLRDAGCRLMTLVGPGGVGKTRLALEAARVAVPRFRDGVYAIDLAPVSSRDGMAAAIAEAVGTKLESGSDSSASMVRSLASRELLLVLDNVEHLAAAPGLVRDLLQGAPGVRILATSRVALELAAEWHWDVPGLAHRGDADQDAVARAAATGGREADGAPEPSEAAALFVAAGRRASRGFAPGPEDLRVIERIATRLEGLPLAIELAAAWLRVLDVEAIGEELNRGLDLLASPAIDRPERHASMRRVLDQSWSLLQPREKTAMRLVAVFRGGFDLAAARTVARLELPVLLALVNKSFLRRGADGRFSRHPLVWRHARERALAHEAEYEAVQERHAHYYLRLLADRRLAATHPEIGRLMQEIQLELDNVAVAWRWAVANGRDDLLIGAVGGLAGFRWARGWYELVDGLFSEAFAAAPAEGALRGLLLAARGFSELWQGRGDFGLAKLREGVRLVEGRVDDVDWAWVHIGMGLVLARHGRHDEAAAAYDVAAAVHRETGEVDAELMVWNNRNQSASTVSEGLRWRRELASRASQMGSARVLYMAMGGIALHEQLLGEFSRAERTARSRRGYAGDAARVSFSVFHARNTLALAYLEGGRLRRAEAVACCTLQRPAFAGARERFGDAVAVATALVGRVALARGDVAAAAAWSTRALEQHRANHGREAAFDLALETLARVALASDDHAGAGAWLESVGRGPEPLWFAGRLVAQARSVACGCCAAEVALARGEVEAARVTVSEALESATSAELITATLGALLSAARVFRVIEGAERADALLRYVRAHPRATFETRSAAAFELTGAPEPSGGACDDGVDGVIAVASRVMAALVAEAS